MKTERYSGIPFFIVFSLLIAVECSYIISLMMESSEMIVIVDKEGGEHQADAKLLDMSEYLKSMKENGGIQNNKIILDTIQGSILTKVIEFCWFNVFNCHL